MGEHGVMNDSHRLFLSLSAAALTLATALPAAAADPRQTTAWCAAFWYGWTDAAATLRYLPDDPADAALAAAFRNAAVAEGAEAASLDRWLKQERRGMALMVKAAIAGDDSSRELMERTARRCEDAAVQRGLL